MGRGLLGLVAMAAMAAGCIPMEEGVNAPFPGILGREAAAPHPAEAPPGERGDTAAWRRAVDGNGPRIVVSRESLRLWLLDGDTVVFAAPVAVGRDTIFTYGSRSWDFNTPTGRMRVQEKEEEPLWVPPDWHYLEKASERGLEPVYLRSGQRVLLADSTVIQVRGLEVGRINHYGNWHPFTPGGEIIFDDKIFIPPIGSPQRRIPNVLGTHRLILGDGYLIHGTPEEDSIGEWASHGCVRLRNDDIQRLYGLVAVGTPVYVY